MKSQRGKNQANHRLNLILSENLILLGFILVFFIGIFTVFNAINVNAVESYNNAAANNAATSTFDFTKLNEQTSLCPRETGIFTDVVKNTDVEPREFTIAVKGSAAAWSTVIPNGFILAPGESKTIYSYATPLQNSAPANYDLGIVVTSQGVNKEASHTVVVKNCYASAILTNNALKSSCPGDSVKYELVLTNNGEYRETFNLNVEGQLRDSVILSEKTFFLEKGDAKKIYAYVTSPKLDGSYSFSVNSIGQLGKKLENVNLVLNVNPCYKFDVSVSGNNAYSMCEKTLLNVPIRINNKGTVSNIYTVNVDGPIWAKIDKSQFKLYAGENAVVNLAVIPGLGINGDFKTTVKILPQLGDYKAITEFNFNVRKCHSVQAGFDEQIVEVCNGLTKNFDATITNNGEFPKLYSFNYESPEWIAPNIKQGATISLDAGKQQKISFTAKPSEDVNKSNYNVVIKVNAIDDTKNKVFATANTAVNNILADECYKPSINTESDKINIYYDSSVSLPLTIKNEGRYKVDYNILISGSASSFVKLTPAVISVDAGKSETAYLYIAPTPHLTPGNYDITISLKLKDGSFLASKNIPITVTSDNLDLQVDKKLSLWQRVKGGTVNKWNYFFPKQTNEVLDIDNENSSEQLLDETGNANKENIKTNNNNNNIKVDDDAKIVDNTVINELNVDSNEAFLTKGKNWLYENKNTVLIAIVVVLFLLILMRLGFFKKLSDFLDEDE